MHEFTYSRANDVQEAIAALTASSDARFIAGGTTLIDLMKLDVESPDRLVDINRLPLDTIAKTSEGGLRIGTTARNSTVAYHSSVRELYLVLSEVLLSGASGQLRNMATIGGNLMQRTRCTHFRDTHWACNKRIPGSGCSALDGYHRGHAIFGTSDSCFATSPSDMNVALLALDAIIETQGPNGPRRIPIGDFHTLPGDTPHIETVLETGELVTEVELPRPVIPARSGYRKVRDRASYELAVVSVAALLEIDGRLLRSARIAFGGVAAKPWRASSVEQLLTGRHASDDLFQAAAEKAVEGAAPRRQNQFKIELLKRTLIRTLHELTGEAP